MSDATNDGSNTVTLQPGQVLHIRARYIATTEDGLLIEAGSAFGVRALCVAPGDVVHAAAAATLEVGDQVRWTRDPEQAPRAYRVCGIDGVFAWIKPTDAAATTGPHAMGRSVPMDELAYLGRLAGPRSPYEAIQARRAAS